MDGLLALRYCKAIAAGRGDMDQARAFARSRSDWSGYEQDAIVNATKAVSGLDSSDITNGSSVQSDLLEAVRPLSVVGRLPLRRTPAQVPMLTQTTGSRAYWVGQGAARKMCVGTYARDQGMKLKSVAAIMAATNEALQDRSLAGDQSLLADLLLACAEALDRAFLDVTNAGGDSVPQSVTYGATAIAHSGGAVADLDEDLRQAMTQLAAVSNLRSAHWVMSSALAGSLSLTRAADGSLAYPTLGAMGGTLAGLPVITSASAVPEANTDDDDDIVLLDASQISYAEAPPELRTSQDAMLEMSDAPTGVSTTPVAASVSLVGMWQNECTALKATLRAIWKVRRAGAVQIITGVPRELSAS